MRHSKIIVLSLFVVVAVILFITLRAVLQPVQAPPVVDQTAISLFDAPVPIGSIPWGIVLDKKENLWLALPGCDPNPRCVSTLAPGKITVYDPVAARWLATYPLPAGFGQPLFLAFDAQGRLWFPMFETNSIGMFNPADKTFHQWTVPTPKSGPWAIAIDHHGYIWFTEHYLNQIGRFDPATQTFSEIATPAARSNPYGITIDTNDNIWFTENNSSVALIGEYTAQGQLQEYKLPSTDIGNVTPHLIVVDSHGNIWWSEGIGSKIGRLSLASAKPGTSNGVTEYTYPKLCTTCSSHTSGIGVDHSGNIWFDDSLQGIIGFFPDTGQGKFSVYNTLTRFSHPHDGLVVDAHDHVWFSEEVHSQLGLAMRSNTSS